MADAKNAPAGSGGLVFLPYLLGERTPVWDANARGVFLGLSLATGRAEAARAVLEGVACAWRQMLELLEKEFDFRPPEIVTAGGGSTNNLWNQIKATMLDRPLIVLNFNDVGSLGACLTAGLGSGVFKTPQQAFELTAPLRNSHIVEPVPEWKDALDTAYERYDQLYPAVRHLF
jgi:xylulokinase